MVTFFLKEAIQRWIEILTRNKIRMKLQVKVAGNTFLLASWDWSRTNKGVELKIEPGERM